MDIYVSPVDQVPLDRKGNFLHSAEGEDYPILEADGFSIPVFVREKGALPINDIYHDEKSLEHYKNFKEWLFQTFSENEQEFRLNLMKKVLIESHKKILITGCGSGEDIEAALELSGPNAHVYATDISLSMLRGAAHTFKGNQSLSLAVCDGCYLPFPSHYFDAVFHFGGINYFGNTELAIKEMTRVVRSGGRVGFGDESVAPWLRHLDYGKIALANNKLWEALPPVEKLSFEATDVKIEWVLGNCFYFISFTKKSSGPFMNIDVPHKGVRGGTMRTRYYGILEGVSVQTKELVLSEAKKRGMSVSDYLEKALVYSLEQ